MKTQEAPTPLVLLDLELFHDLRLATREFLAQQVVDGLPLRSFVNLPPENKLLTTVIPFPTAPELVTSSGSQCTVIKEYHFL